MSLSKLFNRIFWHNNTTPDINEDNLNAMSKGLSDVDDRLISLAGTIMEDVPQIQEDIADLQEAEATFNAAIQSAQDAATNAQNSANAAAGSVTSAQQKTLIAEGWAKGTQNGSPVSQSSPYWENNAEYYANEARHFTPEGYQDLVDDVDDIKQTLTGEVVDSEPYVLRQGLGNLADMELVGGSVAWNQLVQNGNFSDGTNGWNSNGTLTVSNNVLTFKASNRFGNVTQNIANKPNHKLLMFTTAKAYVNSLAYIQLRLFSSLSPSTYTDETIQIPATKTTLAKIINIPGNIVQTSYMIQDNSYSSFDNIEISNVQIFDLTQMFGTTIADYIYSLEQATAGAGVAWFRKYFPNAYYGYQSGKIESVNVASRKAIGFNQWDEQLELGMYNTETGEKTPTTATLRNVNKIDVFPNTVYYCCSNILIRYLEYDANGKYLGTNTTTNTTFRTQKDTAYLNIQCGLNYEYICINISKTTGTPKNGDYVPYSGAEYPFANKQLRGIFYLDANNKLCANGDIWKANESITRKYGIVDLGTLNYTAASVGNGTLFYTGYNPISNMKNTTLTTDIANAVCILTIKSQSNVNAGNAEGLSIGPDSSRIRIFSETTYKNMTAAQFKTAMSGVYLVYELAVPTTESAEPFQNPQRAFIDGTEEFIDYGVQSATRDVSIPVGNNTTYQLNETLPPIEDYVDGAVKFKAAISALGTDESGRTTASRAYTTSEFFYKDGKMYKVLTSIAQGATFTINTNCQQTTLFAELKALAQ